MNDNEKEKIIYSDAGEELYKEKKYYNQYGILLNQNIYLNRYLKEKHIFYYENNKLIQVKVHDENNKPLKIGFYEYNDENKLKSIKFYKMDFAGKNTNYELERWDYNYDYDQKRILINYSRKDGKEYRDEIVTYKDNNFQKIDFISYYEEKYNDLLSDFYFQPKYNKDGDIIGFLDEPINKYKLMILPIIITSSIILVIVFIFGIFFSHRLAGPVFRIKKYINEMKNGKYGNELKLRKGDALQDLADELFKLSKSLDKKLNK